LLPELKFAAMTRTVVFVCVTTVTWAGRLAEKHKAPRSITLLARGTTFNSNCMNNCALSYAQHIILALPRFDGLGVNA
jgi:hypothetical protein